MGQARVSRGLERLRMSFVAGAVTTNEKGPTFVGPVSGLTPSANRPDPDGPGGLGAEESGTERTGSTQNLFFAGHGGGRWAEVGQQYDSANVPVTRNFPQYRRTRRNFRRNFKGPLAVPGG